MQSQQKKKVESPIISCSRRTDIPAFLMDWVIEHIKKGSVDWTNPFNRAQVAEVSLSPKVVKCWVWWSKNFGNWIEVYQNNEELFKTYKGHCFQFTINSPSELESGVKVSLEERFTQLDFLISEFGTTAVNFRYDPIIVYMNKNSTKVKSNTDRFEEIVEKVSSFGLKEMIFSFATIYPKVKKRMEARGYVAIDIPLKNKQEILERLLKICDRYDMKMKACCQPDLLVINGVEQAHCIDGDKIEKIIGESITNRRDTGQREGCGCTKSKDIGGYTGIFRCAHNCSYCYASPAKK